MSTFSRVPTELLAKVAAHELKLNHLGLYAILAKFADNATGECWPSRRTLAKECGLSRADKVDPLLDALKKAGAITIEERFRSKSEPYTFGSMKSEEHPEQLSSMYRLTGFAGARHQDTSGTPEPRGTPNAQNRTTPSPENRTTGSPENRTLTRPIELDPKELQANDRVEALRQQDDWTDAEYRELRAAGYVCHNWKHWAKPPRRKSHDDIPPLPDWVTPELRRAAKAKNITDFRLWPKVREAEKPHVNSRVGLLRSLIANEQEHQPRRHWEEI